MTTEPSPVTWAQLKTWLTAHGAPTERVRSIAFVPEGVGGEGRAIQLRVEHIATNADGQPFVAFTESGAAEVAVEVTWVPLHFLP